MSSNCILYCVFFMNKDFFFRHVVLMCLFFSYVWGQTLFSWWGVLSCIGDAVNAKFQLSATAGNFTSLITLNHIKSTFITLCWLLYYISHTFYLFIYLHSIIVCC